MATKNIIARRFDSLSEYEKYLANGTTQKPFLRYQASQRAGEDERKFRGTSTYEEANGLLIYGDRELASKIEKQGLASTRARLHANVQSIKTEASVVGFMPHVPNYVAGVPLTMINARRVERPSTSLTIVYDVSANCGVAAEEMEAVASRVLSAVMMIEAGGTRVNLYAAGTTREGRTMICAAVRIKTNDKKLDPVRCAYPLVNPSFYRRHFFRFVETTAGVPDSFSNGYGRDLERPHEDLVELLNAVNIRHAVALTFKDLRKATTEEIVERIKKNGQ